MSSHLVVLQVDNALDEVLWIAIDNKGWRWWLIVVVEGVGEFGFELGNMENGMDTNGRRKTEGKGHGGRLCNDGKGADFLLCKFVQGSIGAYVIGVNVCAISDMEQRRLKTVLVHVLAHGILGVLHSFLKELVDFVEVEGEVFCT